MAPKKKPLKDLKPKSTAVKGGKLSANDNITLVRAANPVVKKDLPARKNVKGSKKAV